MWRFDFLKKGLSGRKITFLVLGIFALTSRFTLAQTPSPTTTSSYSSMFTEKILTVNRESDGILPGTLRAALIQAHGLRAQNPFTVVKILFDPQVKLVRITQGALPEIAGSLTTIDCQTASGRVVIKQEGTPAVEEASSEQSLDGLKITSSSNVIRNCHLTGFKGSGIWVSGNRNLLEYNTLGYHPGVAEAAIEGVIGEIKTNEGVGIYLTEGAAENTVQYNELVGNGSHGIELSPQVGGGNKLSLNFFAKNQGKPIKASIGANNTLTPQITSISAQGEMFLIKGVAPRNSEVQLYIQGKEEGEIGQNIVPGTLIPREQFSILTKNFGFTPHQTKLIAIARVQGKNTSEFSFSTLVLGPDLSKNVELLEKPAPILPKPSSQPLPPAEDQPIDEEYNEEDVPYNLQGLGTPSNSPKVGALAS